jgi:hypothetical protein
MAVVSIYKLENVPSVEDIVERLDKRKVNNCLILAQKSKYTDSEVFIQYLYNESVEESIKKAFPEEDVREIYLLLSQNGKTTVMKRVYCFINTITKTLEIYRGKDSVTEEIVAVFEKLLETKITPITLKPEELKKLYEQHSTELNQAIFKNVDGLVYNILRGRCLENNSKFNDYINRFLESLRVISFKPKIRFLNGNNRYQVTVNGDKGTIKFSNPDNGFAFRPRIEIRQLNFMIASVLGLIS